MVPKVGHEAQFITALAGAHQVAHGKLGWQGQAELIHDLDVFEQMFGSPYKTTTKEEQIAEIKELLQQAFLQDIMEHAEWLTEEEAAKRKASQEVLFGDKDRGQVP